MKQFSVIKSQRLLIKEKRQHTNIFIEMKKCFHENEKIFS